MLQNASSTWGKPGWLMIPSDLLLAFLKGEHNMNLFPVLCGFSSSPQVTGVPQGHQPGLSAVLNESFLDPWILIPFWWSCLPSEGWKPRVNCYEHISSHTSFIIFFFFLVIQALIWKWFGLVYMLILFGFGRRKESPSEMKFSHWHKSQIIQNILMLLGSLQVKTKSTKQNKTKPNKKRPKQNKPQEEKQALCHDLGKKITMT